MTQIEDKLIASDCILVPSNRVNGITIKTKVRSIEGHILGEAERKQARKDLAEAGDLSQPVPRKKGKNVAKSLDSGDQALLVVENKSWRGRKSVVLGH
jgi:hypothetical protein